MSTSTDTIGPRNSGGAPRFEVRLRQDGRIHALTELLPDGRRRVLQPFSRDGLGVLTRGLSIEYRFDEERRLRDLPYVGVLGAIRQEILLTATKVRHGELFDEPDALPALKTLLARVEETQEAFRRVCEASTAAG